MNHNSHQGHTREEKLPGVSVVMITFNQERYIRKAIESVLAQKTDVAYELIIADDCSVDKTRDICIEFQKQRPDVIRLILRETNLGIVQNSVQTLKESRGKYIAFCEGDDFWTDPCKLQRQYELLESKPHVTGIHTRVNYCDLNGHITGTSDLVPNDSVPVDLNYLLQKNVIHTCSFMFRRSILDSTAFSVLGQSPIQDYTVFLIMALRGNIVYLPTTTAVYRKNAGVTSAWTFSGLIKDRLEIYALFEKQYDLTKYRRSLHAAKQFQYFHLLSLPQKGWENVVKCRCATLLLWYTFLSFILKPDVKVYKITWGDVVKLIFKSRFRLKNWRKFLSCL